MHVESRKI
jgi:glutathione S-transferase